MTISPAVLGAFLRASRDSDGPSEHQLEDGSWIVVKPGAAPGQERIVEQQDAERNVTLRMTFLAPDAAAGARPASWPQVAGHRMAQVQTGGELLLLWPGGDEELHAEVVQEMEARGWKAEGGERSSMMGRTIMRSNGHTAAASWIAAGPVNLVTVEGLPVG